MTLRRVGFFCELRHGVAGGPSLLAACTGRNWPDHKSAAEYLRHGSIVVTTGVMADDVIDPTNSHVAPLAVLTDGVWAWPAELAYYVDKYGCELPPEFVDHMRGASWRPRLLSNDELVNIGRELRSGAQ